MRGTPVLFFGSLNRRFHILGVERQLFFLIIALTMPIAMSAKFRPLMDIMAAVIFILLHSIGVLITRVDYQFLAVFRRHIHQQRFYLAHPLVDSRLPIRKPSVPVYQGQRGLV